MKLLKLSFLFLAILSIAACGEDDEQAVCLQADWVGTYTGTETCDGEDPEDVQITITASGTDAIIIVYSAPGTTTTFDPIAINGCSLTASGSDQGITLAVDATLNGDDFRLTNTLTQSGVSSTCVIEGSRN